VFNSMRHEETARRQDLIDQLSREQRTSLQDDLDELEEFLASSDLSGTRTLVVFKSGLELSRAVRLPVGMVDTLTIEVDPYIVPLEAVMEEHPPALVIEAAKDRSGLWSYTLGHLAEIDAVKSFVPSETVDRSRPAKVQRHRLTHLDWHLRRTAQLADRVVMDQGFDLLVLSGDRNVLTELERYLPDRLRVKIAGRLPKADDRARWQQGIEEIVRQHRRAQEESAVAALGDHLGTGLVAQGLRDVIDLSNEFLIRRLYVSVSLRHPGYVCREHHFVSLDSGRCPFDDRELPPTENMVNELVELARLQGVELNVIEERPDLLEPYGGIAAVAYDMPAEAPGNGG
jgi:peptide subunit release factor 1 (eRF1)